MRSPWSRALTALAAALAVALTASPAAVAGFSLTTNAAPSLSVTLSGSDQTAVYTMDLDVDNSGVGASTAGWNLTVTSTPFTTGVASLPATASTITAVAVACTTGPCTDPANSVSYPVAVPAGASPPPAVKFFSTPAVTGIGGFRITPTVQVFVPANAYAGTYTSTLTLTLVSGP